MAKNKMSDLRDHLFETLEGLKDEDKPMDVKRAQAISQVASAIIESAKVEVAAMKLIDGKRPSSDFFGMPAEERPQLAEARPAKAS